MVDIPKIKKSSICEDVISWEDLQGLSWMITDDESRSVLACTEA